MAQFDNLIVNGFSRFLNSATGNLVGSATYAGSSYGFSNREIRFNTVTCALSASTAGIVSELNAERKLTFTGDLSGSISGIKGGVGTKSCYVYIVKLAGNDASAVTASASSGYNSYVNWYDSSPNQRLNFLDYCYSAKSAGNWVTNTGGNVINSSKSSQSAWDWISSHETGLDNIRNSANSGYNASSVMNTIMTANASAKSAKSATSAKSAGMIDNFTGTAKNVSYIGNLKYTTFLNRYNSGAHAYNLLTAHSGEWRDYLTACHFAYYEQSYQYPLTNMSNVLVEQNISNCPNEARTYILDAACSINSNTSTDATNYTEYISSYMRTTNCTKLSYYFWNNTTGRQTLIVQSGDMKELNCAVLHFYCCRPVDVYASVKFSGMDKPIQLFVRNFGSAAVPTSSPLNLNLNYSTANSGATQAGIYSNIKYPNLTLTWMEEESNYKVFAATY